jgi:adenosylcobinamide-GDP ribazoletransferase
MADTAEMLRRATADLKIAVSLCTRFPLVPHAPLDDGDVARASWAFPIAGLLVALAGGVTYWLANRLHVQPEPGSALALVATALFTGAMHEDGLADTVDGWGGNSPEQRLEIMGDSRIGTYGACALALSFLLRWTTLADIGEIADIRTVVTALIVAHTVSRAVLPAFMYLVPSARAEGLSSSAGRPPGQSVAIAIALGILCLLLVFGPKLAMIALLLLALEALALARVATRQIGGQTGDVLGAMQQIAEATLLVMAAAML